MTVQKSGNASTLTIVSKIRAMLPKIAAALPSQLVIRPLFDQSLFVKASLQGVLRESAIAGVLTALMILLVFGKLAQHPDHCHFHSAVDLDFAAHFERAGRNHQHHDAWRTGTGGRNPGGRRHCRNRKRRAPHAMGEELQTQFWPAHRRSRHPPLLPPSDLHCLRTHVFSHWSGSISICAVCGVGDLRALASYFFSRTLVPTMVKYLLPAEVAAHRDGKQHRSLPVLGFLHQASERGFERLRSAYERQLAVCLANPKLFGLCFVLFCVVSVGLLFTRLGQDFFPQWMQASFGCICEQVPGRGLRILLDLPTKWRA